MKRMRVLLLAAFAATSLVLSVCTQGAAAPAPKVDFPVKGNIISVIVPYAAGGTTDISVRLLSSLMEKHLGTPCQVVNKPGAGAQVGLTEGAKAKPNGYTISTTCFPAAISTYLDRDRKALYNRESWVPLGEFMDNPSIAFVRADSPFQNVKDVVDAAKAKPEKITVGHTGGFGPSHLGLALWQQAAGVKFGPVQFDGGSPIVSAVLGGHLDVGITITPELVARVKAGQLRLLGLMDPNESKFVPSLKTFVAQGYNVVSRSPCGLSVPAGTPKEVVDLLAAAMKTAVKDPEWIKKMDTLSVSMKDPDPPRFAALWRETEAQVKPLIEMLKKASAK